MLFSIRLLEEATQSLCECSVDKPHPGTPRGCCAGTSLIKAHDDWSALEVSVSKSSSCTDFICSTLPCETEQTSWIMGSIELWPEFVQLNSSSSLSHFSPVFIWHWLDDFRPFLQFVKCILNFNHIKCLLVIFLAYISPLFSPAGLSLQRILL